MGMTGGGQIDGRSRVDLMREEIVHEELRQERWGRDVPDSLKRSTRRVSIYMVIGVISVALLVGLIWFVL